MDAAYTMAMELLADALGGDTSSGPVPDWNAMLPELEKHNVLALVQPRLKAADLAASEALYRRSQQNAQMIISQNYRLLFLAKYLIGLLEDAGIPVALLKGGSVARYYPVPELRKSGDVDLLLMEPERLPEAKTLFQNAGLLLSDQQFSAHHLEWITSDGIAVELHTEIVEAFNESAADRCIREQFRSIPLPLPRAEIMGLQLPVLPEAFQAYHLLLHMLRHFKNAGFGLRLLCDWSVFWNQPVETQLVDDYLSLVEACGLVGFHRMVTSLCRTYLGLRGNPRGLRLESDGMYYGDSRCFCRYLEPELCRQYMEDIHKGGEFGGKEQGRTVSVSGGSLWAYLREFHRQMKRNNQQLGRHPILWPYLWVKTLVVFLRNNRRLARGSAFSILRRAAQRGKLEKRLELFRR